MKPLAETLVEIDVSELRRDHSELTSMTKTRGWQVILDTLAREKETATRALVASPTTPREELDFYRATLRALDMMSSLPEMIKLGLELQFRVAEAKTEKDKSDGDR